MDYIKKEWFGVTRGDVFRFYPLGDIHLGSVACDERKLARVISRVAEDPQAYWIGMGDYIEGVTRFDKRFNPDILPPWITTRDLKDIPRVQRLRFRQLIKPIADKTIAVLWGNHDQIRFQDDSTAREIADDIAQDGDLDFDPLLGYSGWIEFKFYRSADKREGSTTVQINTFHGAGGGGLAGGKALAMERRGWQRKADLTLIGHTHIAGWQPFAWEELRAGKPVTRMGHGLHTGTFLRTAMPGVTTYSEFKGYAPIPLAGVYFEIRPGATDPDEIITIHSR